MRVRMLVQTGMCFICLICNGSWAHCPSALLDAFRRIHSFVSACEWEPWFYWEKHDLPAHKCRWQRTDPLLQSSFLLENADLYELESKCEGKNIYDSPSFDEPYCFFPAGTLGMVSFQPTNKSYGYNTKIFNMFAHMRCAVGFVQSCFWPLRRSLSNDPMSTVNHLRLLLRMDLLKHRREKLCFPTETVLAHPTWTKTESQPAVTFTVARAVQCRSWKHRDAEQVCFTPAPLDTHLPLFHCLSVLHGSAQKQFLK